MEAPEIYTADDLTVFLETLPCFGIVCCVREEKGDYFYIELPKQWQEQTQFLVASAKSLYQYDKKVLSSVHELRKKIKLDAEESFFACPTKVGLHISIGKHKIGERIDFKIEKLMSYQNQTMEKPNQFDKTKFVAHWIAVRVTLLKEIEQVSSAHITFAAIGFEKKT